MPKKPNDPLAEYGPRNFNHFLSQVQHGGLHDELSSTLQDVNNQLSEVAGDVGKAKGTMTIVLSFAHERNGIVSVNADIKTKLPKISRASTVFWTTETGNLVNEDPRQQRLALREVAGSAAPREVAEEPKAIKSV